ncbi:hypothetical protein BUALT_BualtUnG0055000 [Buddleja alternifolia]|uniref:Cysteinyl-tRNA synthetase n=1 Tax=Buddleja alternifolia TaxID=168488 RepID=A0AAV6W6K6_9LAMI|nr:hypothetical protein BUALT_BualtUnG0055000 [Buddleja alternifolia]
MEKKRPEFQVYNSMTKLKEVFKPRIEGKVGMYVCGVTSYDLSHIGHARAYVAFDVLYRYLRYLGYEVVYVRNFTDVDDKIIRRANEVGEGPKALSGRFCQEFLSDMADLQCLVPTHQPRVTDHMEQIKDMIAQLEDNRAGERVAVDGRKQNPADFALWKAAKPGEPLWDSPWGPGRPDGTSNAVPAMSAHYLTHSFDIHGGGMDLIFPHHENEIAQSCAACSESKVNYWMHNGFVTENDEKMSKSLKKQPKQQQLSIVKSLIDLEKEVKQVLDVIGLLSGSSYAEVLQQLKDKALKRASLTENDILHSIEERMLARKNKEFSKSD